MLSMESGIASNSSPESVRFSGLQTFKSGPPRPRAIAKAVEAKGTDSDEERRHAFTYLRGSHDRAPQIAFRFRDGNSEVFPHSVLGPWRHNPSFGIMLQFTGGDVVTVVLVRGSNPDTLDNNAMNLTDRGLLPQRIVSIREMDEDELRRVGDGELTIDGIEIAEFESNEAL